jgi:hypothetical protein
MHDNSFFFDEKQAMLYLSLRNISRVIKLQYSQGKVVNEYGERFERGQPEKFSGLFCRQHSCRVAANGDLYLYNNNVCKPGSMPTLVRMRQPAHGHGQPEKVWEFTCTVDRDFDLKKFGGDFSTGGNVYELSDGAMFASMGGFYSKLFIVNSQKKILWSALPEKWDTTKHLWLATYSYRASMIESPAALIRLVWGQ